MASVTDHLIKLQELTQTNLGILQALNDALYTKQNHLAVNVGNKTYSIPSFVSLENKINNLQANFENLVNAPATGEAYFNFDGNSRAIEVRGYTHTPNSIILDNVSNFNAETNNIFKDFLTPNPYINVGLSSLPNDITTVLVKKIIPIHEDLVNLFKSELQYTSNDQVIYKTSKQYAFKDLYKILANYIKDTDYIEYDSKLDLPVHESIGNGLYVIQQIISDVIDDNLDEYITIKFRNDISNQNYSNKLSYKLFNETIERSLQVGDQLVTFDDSAKLEITEIHQTDNTLVLKVLNGEYLNLFESDTNDVSKINNLCKLKFFSPINFDKDKYVKVSLEEDRYVFIAVAALNNRMNIQAPWGTGLMLDTYNLMGPDNKESFKTFYDNNVNNVGDVLFEITSMMTNTLTKYNKHQYESFTSIKPIINTDNILVTQINKHLNNSTSISNIRSLYSQKNDYISKLNEINTQIESINTKLSELSFDDTTNIRSTYESQLTSLISSKNKLNVSIVKISNDISRAANDSEIPIENAKYRIRGFFDCGEFLKNNDLYDLLNNHIRGIRVQYRYKNVEQEQGTALSINSKFIFSDWIDMPYMDLQRVPYYQDGYKFKLEQDNSNINEPSYNQIDIPITQGETVDIRLKIVYDLGWPFVYTTSDWSDIVNIKFPEEYLKDVQILDIIKENNEDIETQKFNNIIKETGIIDHLDDKTNDQSMGYHHKAEHIASGFFESDGRIISLKDKLTSVNLMVTELYDDIHGSNNEHVNTSIINGDMIYKLEPGITNNINVSSYDTFTNIDIDQNQDVSDGNYIYNSQTGLVTTLLNIKITNNSEHTMKIYSIFPGSRDTDISKIVHTKTGIHKEDYVDENGHGVYCLYDHIDENGNTIRKKNSQTANQFITFRIKDVNNGEEYYNYAKGSTAYKNNFISSNPTYINYDSNPPGSEENCAYIYPLLVKEKSLCLDSDTIGAYKLLGQQESILIPIVFEYRLKNANTNNILSKTMSFDIRTSLYNDPITYTFKVTAKNVSTTQDKTIAAYNSLINKHYSPLYK